MTATTMTYRGDSLEELLPQIRAELGPDALIMTQREGIVGGVGGFFGKRCVEVEAMAPVPQTRATAVPPRAAVDAYDSGVDADNLLVETLLSQAAPFAEQLEEKLAEPAVDAAPEIEAAPVQTPAVDEDAVADALRAWLPKRAASEILAEANDGLRPFEPETPLRELAQRALARKLKVSHGARTKQRTIAIVGRTNTGRTSAAARLANVHASAGRSVVALSLEPVRNAFELGELTDPEQVRLEVADTPDLAARAREVHVDADVIIADLPPVDPSSRDSVEQTLELLDALDPDEIQLAVRAQGSLEENVALADALSPWKKWCRVLATRTDAGGGAAVGLAVAARLPLSYVGTAEALRPAEPEELARLVLP